MEHLQSAPESVWESGRALGAREAALFLTSPAAEVEPFYSAYAWLDRVIADGRRTLKARNVPDMHIEIWDNACRIAFLLSTLRKRNENAL